MEVIKNVDLDKTKCYFSTKIKTFLIIVRLKLDLTVVLYIGLR